MRDANTVANDRCLIDYDDYAGDPSVFFDGGLEPIVGGGIAMRPFYEAAILSCGERPVPPLEVLTAIHWIGESVVRVYVAVGNGVYPNTGPAGPGAPSGPASMLPDQSYQFSATTTDPDGNDLYYQFDWGGELSEWLGPVASGSNCEVSRSWAVQGDFEVRVRAKDPFEVETGWSEPLLVSVDRCQGRVGDANGQGGDEPTIGDVSLLIDALFITASVTPLITPPACIEEADINLSSQNAPSHWPPVFDDITIGDISGLIDALFITADLSILPNCP